MTEARQSTVDRHVAAQLAMTDGFVTAIAASLRSSQ
jgi:hypothetical protein